MLSLLGLLRPNEYLSITIVILITNLLPSKKEHQGARVNGQPKDHVKRPGQKLALGQRMTTAHACAGQSGSHEFCLQVIVIGLNVR